MNRNIKAVCFGEVLWDIFPDRKTLGGAPLNVALGMHAMGIDTQVVSKVGKDSLGTEIYEYLHQQGISPLLIKQCSDYPTGQVQVNLNEEGSATYEIISPVAWDQITLDSGIKSAVQQADVFVFGSLAARNEVSKKTLFQLLELATFSVFDVNLRPPYYTPELLIRLIKKASFIKFNDDELLEIAQFMGSDFKTLNQNIHYVASKSNTSLLCVTRGEHGAIYYDHGTIYSHSGFQIEVADSVGAGDAFLAGLITQLMQKKSPLYILEFACAMGALVAKHHGANPKISIQDVLQIRS